MDDKRNEQIIVSDFDDDFWCELFDLQVINIRECVGEFDGVKLFITKLMDNIIYHTYTLYIMITRSVHVYMMAKFFLEIFFPQKQKC